MPAVKYDFDTAFMLYMGKMPIDKIAAMLGIPENYLIQVARKRSWYHRRNEAILAAKHAVDRDLKKKIEDYKNKHLNFMLDQGEEIQDTIGKIDLEEAPGMVGMKLELLEKHHGIQSKVLKLDEPDKSDPNTMGFHVLIALQKRGSSNGLVNDRVVELDDAQISEIDNNETAKTDALRSISHNSEVVQNTPLRRSIPFGDKNANTGILSSLNGIGIENEETKTLNSGQSGIKKKEEPKPKLIELAKELGISKGTGLPPLQ